jgi:hypothetical protein
MATALFSIAAFGVSVVRAKMFDMSTIQLIKTFDYSYLANLHCNDTLF